MLGGGGEAAMSVEVRRSHLSDPGQEKDFADRLIRLSARIDCRRADTSEEREAIFRLRYEAYTREGAISPNASGKFSDPYDYTDNAHLFGLYIDGELASSLRLHVTSREISDFPSREVFPDVLQPLLDAGNVLIDSTRFVADERLSRIHRGLQYVTLRPCMLAAEYFRADHCLAAVRAEHQGFYRRAFNHQVISKSRPYPQLAKPISLMTLHFPSASAGLYQRYPFFHSTEFERRALFDRPEGAAPSHHEHAQERRQGLLRPFVEFGAARPIN
jgi:N-acyl-L-homoserine lactone synthetase